MHAANKVRGPSRSPGFGERFASISADNKSEIHFQALDFIEKLKV